MSRTSIPHTFENQNILRQYGQELSQRFDDAKPAWYEWIQSNLPGSDTIGGVIGEQVGTVYGAQMSNAAIDLVVGRFFETPTAPTSFWAKLGWLMWGTAEVTVAETLKLTFTPKAMPYITLVMGVLGGFALGGVVLAVSAIYNKIVNNPYRLHQLPGLQQKQLFREKNGQYYDSSGRVLDKKDVMDLLADAAKYDVIRKMIGTFHTIDTIGLEDAKIQKFVQKEFKKFVKSQQFKREDGKMMFADGTTSLSKREIKIIKAGIRDLSRVNSGHREKHVRKFVDVIAAHSMPPQKVVSDISAKYIPGTGPKRIPSLFQEEESVWKNAIIQADDGEFVMSQDVGEKKKGTIISREEMVGIFGEINSIKKKQVVDKQQDLHKLIVVPKQHKKLEEHLCLMRTKEVETFLSAYIIQQKSNGGAHYLNGDALSQDELTAFQMSLKALPSRGSPKKRAKAIHKLVQEVAQHIPSSKDLEAAGITLGSEGAYKSQNGKVLTYSQVATKMKNHHAGAAA